LVRHGSTSPQTLREAEILAVPGARASNLEIMRYAPSSLLHAELE